MSMNRSEQHSCPTPLTAQALAQLDQPTTDRESSRDIRGLRVQVVANAAYMAHFDLPERIDEDGHVAKLFDVVVRKDAARYKALLYVSGEAKPGIEGGYSGTVIGALESLLDVSCETVARAIDTRTEVGTP